MSGKPNVDKRLRVQEAYENWWKWEAEGGEQSDGNYWKWARAWRKWGPGWMGA